MFSKQIDEVFKIVNSKKDGLSRDEAEYRLLKNGPNRLKDGKKKSGFARFFAQFTDLLIIILLISCAISTIMALVNHDYSELVDAGFILLVVIINATIGFVQENKAQNALNALRNLTKPFCKVLRDGKTSKIRTENLVVGDVVLLEAGDIVPADLRIFSCASLKIDESTLSGESVPIDKQSLPISDENVPIFERTNIAYMGTVVCYGRAHGVVIATASDTQMGKIADLINESAEEKTLLEKRIDKTSKIISLAVLSVCAVIFCLNAINNNISSAFMVAISIAVCAIPEGLPAGVTITMALGVSNMSKQRAIVRRINAVETLGTVEIICSDKTGTLTLNKMTVQEIYVKNINGQDIKLNPNYSFLINCMLLCNDSEMQLAEDGATISCIGDPTETALVYYGFNNGFSKEVLCGSYPRVNEIPFDSKRKLMTTLNTVGNVTIAHTKGAIDSLLNRCSYILDGGIKREITYDDKLEILNKNSEMANKALRVLAYANKEVTGDIYNITTNELEKDLTFVGLTGMIDPPREEVFEAIKQCKRASITPIMITGDHSDTAYAIANQLGICDDKMQVITGQEIDLIDDEKFVETIQNYRVFARVSPEHKVKIVSAYKKIDKIVAMTGDGVNDAPSIKSADIGVGMGMSGTDVTKEVSDIILTDDNFATIVGAVKEGRRIYANIIKIIQFLMSTSFAEVVIMGIIIAIFDMPFFGPALILWINIVSDTLPGLALGVEKAESDIMDNPPNTNRKHIFTGEIGSNIFIVGTFQAIMIVSLYFILHYLSAFTVAEITTICFVCLVMIELFHSYNIRSNEKSIFKIGVLSNKYLNLAFLASFALTALLVVLPISPIQNILGITSITFIQWLIAVGCAFLIVPFVEIYKVFVRKIRKRKKDKLKE